MILKRFYDPKLAQASYLIGCGKTGESLVIDPNRDTDQYLRMARSEGVRITHVTETHIHADFVSGSRQLARAAGAQLLLSGEGGTDWSYRFAREDGAELLKEGSVFFVGKVRLEVQHTPGHTPEHLLFIVTDTAAADRPIGLVTGDFVFVGDVGRPDLLEKAAKVQGTMVAGARQLFQSLQRFREQPDYLQIWPGHGAGSACGKGLSAIPHSTVGYERLFNWALGVTDEDAFVQHVLEGQPEPPRYFAEMKRVNRDGPPLGNQNTQIPVVANERLDPLLAEGAVILDTRPASEYAAGHVRGTLNIPLNKAFTNWAGWLLPYDQDIYLLTGTRGPHGKVAEAVRDLSLIGLDRVAGYFEPEVINSRAADNGALATIEPISADQLASLAADGQVSIVDVRTQAEWDAGHIAGATHIPLGHLAERSSELPRDRTTVVHCQGGSRSAIGASVLDRLGFADVRDMGGGYTEWSKAMA